MSAEKPIKLAPSATMDSPRPLPVAPFDLSKIADDEPQFDVNPFTPRHKVAAKPARPHCCAGWPRPRWPPAGPS